MKISENKLRSIIRSIINENINTNNNNNNVEDLIESRLSIKLSEIGGLYRDCKTVIESYDNVRDIIISELFDCGISYANIGYEEYSDNAIEIIFDGINVNINKFVHYYGCDTSDYDFSNPNDIIEFLFTDGSFYIEHGINDGGLIKRSLINIPYINFSRDGKKLSITLEFPFDL